MIIRDIFKSRSRILHAIITLIISLVTILLLCCIFGWLTASFGGLTVYPELGFVFPWTNCSFYEYGYDYSIHPSERVYSPVMGYVCKGIQMWEYELIIITVLVIVVPPAIEKIKRFRQKS
ncbi:MAG: hypothetical protein KAU03_00255 [Candidatus Altiarchaeales archaeon]|nr:hypothetical protein [Candidatus Altiarchaeales archaeon]